MPPSVVLFVRLCSGGKIVSYLLQLLPFSFPELRSFWSASGIDSDADQRIKGLGTRMVICWQITTGNPNSVGVRWTLNFRSECMEINKIRPKFHFLTKIEIKMTYLVVLFCFFYCLFASRAIWKPFYWSLRSWAVLTIRKMWRLGTLKPTITARSFINPIKIVQTHQNCRQRICR